MTMESWHCAADVAADLARAGAEPPRRAALLPAGRRPAACQRTEEDLTEEQLAELSGGGAATGRGAGGEPDLRGITHMLRMVETNCDEIPYTAGDRVVLTKPPRTDINANVDNVKADSNADVNADVNVDVNAGSKTALNPDVPEFIPRRERSPVTSPGSSAADEGREGREREAERLRDEIRVAGAGDRYRPIARLMRLYAAPAPPPAQLLTPAYFERPPPSAESCDVDPQQVRASIAKVTSWLDPAPKTAPSPTRSPARLHARPVAFRARRRPEPAPRSPSPPAPAAPAPCNYVPSAAEDLLRQYEARVRAAEGAGDGGVWGRLEEELRRRDAAALGKRRGPEGDS